MKRIKPLRMYIAAIIDESSTDPAKVMGIVDARDPSEARKESEKRWRIKPHQCFKVVSWERATMTEREYARHAEFLNSGAVSVEKAE